MSVTYTWVSWTKSKRTYDLALAAFVALYISVFVGVSSLALRGDEAISPEILVIRALGTCALVMLHAALWIGPLVRLVPKLSPLLYNRRHLGVATFLVGLAHAALSTMWYHGFGDVNPLVSLLTANTSYFSPSRFPFEIPGIVALIVLFVLAATSHDFWLGFLTPAGWKRLHMAIYFAYFALVMHVGLGALQSERSIVTAVVLAAGALTTIVLHLVAGAREIIDDLDPTGSTDDGLLDVCGIDELPADRALIVCPRGRDRIALFKHEGRVSALSNLCAHQGGPIGEGRIVDGCVTCPWHGWQYRPSDGKSPPPFTERIPTYQVTLRGGRVLVDPAARPLERPAEPAELAPDPAAAGVSRVGRVGADAAAGEARSAGPAVAASSEAAASVRAAPPIGGSR